MKPFYALLALTLAASAAACKPSPQTESVSAGTPEAVASHSPAVGAATQTLPEGEPGGEDTLALTPFEPTTVEIYCRFQRQAENGELGGALFITEIAGVPAPAAIGLEGQAVRLEEVSKTEQDGAAIWTYRNEERPVEVQLTLTETDEGFEYRAYEGTIRIMDPVQGDIIPIEGTCGV
ncbi:hypothetical protein [Hyphomonas sp.]|uniref:hypothetical protein n=1 Tax=Hyphomonas sp. TaxID=87 RepID=UPI0025C038E9|nr:hypothetical protein [Hyphomonas sp.]